MGAAAARLDVVGGNAAGMSIYVEGELVIGRHAEGPGRLADDEEISREHARLTCDPNGLCAIEDLGSTNGTFVNGLRISAPQTLSEGDTVEIGGTALVVAELIQVETRSAAPQQTHDPIDRSDLTPRSPAAAADAVESATPVAEHADRGADASPLPPPYASLRLEIDFAVGEARLSLSDSPEQVRLAFSTDARRAESSPPGEGSAP